MKKLVIAFDVDDTLIMPPCVTESKIDTPNYETIAIYKWFQLQGHQMVVWSGSGIDWAYNWADKLGLQPCQIWPKLKSDSPQDHVDICFDDCDVDLADINIKVKRFKNNISRELDNKRKK